MNVLDFRRCSVVTLLFAALAGCGPPVAEPRLVGSTAAPSDEEKVRAADYSVLFVATATPAATTCRPWWAT